MAPPFDVGACPGGNALRLARICTLEVDSRHVLQLQAEGRWFVARGTSQVQDDTAAKNPVNHANEAVEWSASLLGIINYGLERTYRERPDIRSAKNELLLSCKAMVDVLTGAIVS